MFIKQVDYPELKHLGSIIGFLFFPLLCYILFQSEVVFYPHKVLYTQVSIYFIFALLMTRRKLRTFYKRVSKFSGFLKLFKLLIIIFVYCVIDALYLMIPFNIIMKTYAGYNETITYKCFAESVNIEKYKDKRKIVTDYYYVNYWFKRGWFYIDLPQSKGRKIYESKTIKNYYVAFYARKGFFGCYYKDKEPQLVKME